MLGANGVGEPADWPPELAAEAKLKAAGAMMTSIIIIVVVNMRQLEIFLLGRLGLVIGFFGRCLIAAKAIVSARLLAGFCKDDAKTASSLQANLSEPALIFNDL